MTCWTCRMAGTLNARATSQIMNTARWLRMMIRASLVNSNRLRLSSSWERSGQTGPATIKGCCNRQCFRFGDYYCSTRTLKVAVNLVHALEETPLVEAQPE